MAVYFARTRPSGSIKIGWSSNPVSRVQQFGPGVALLAVIPDGDMYDEHAMHARFANTRVRGRHKYRGLSGGGEWYRATPELLAVIADVAAGRCGSRDWEVRVGRER